MARRKIVSNGKCCLCEGVFDKSAMTKHLSACRKERGAESKTPLPKKSGSATAFHLIVEGRYLTEYWMHLEAPAKATLELLDGFLRDVWLECCGHMSAFTIEGSNYSASPMDDYDEKDMHVRLCDVVRPGMKFQHEYDFGSTTYLALKVVSEWDSGIKGKEVRILARNEPPAIVCGKCGQPAVWVCSQCVYEGKGWLCKKCGREHECGEEMLLPVVNSPRVGVCGYTG